MEHMQVFHLFIYLSRDRMIEFFTCLSVFLGISFTEELVSQNFPCPTSKIHLLLRPCSVCPSASSHGLVRAFSYMVLRQRR